MMIAWELAGMPDYRFDCDSWACSSTRIGKEFLPDLGLTVAAADNMTNVTGVNPFALRVADTFARHQTGRDDSRK